MQEPAACIPFVVASFHRSQLKPPDIPFFIISVQYVFSDCWGLRSSMFLPFLGARFGSCPAQQSPRPRVGRAGVRRLDLCTWELESLPKRAMDQEMLIPSYR